MSLKSDCKSESISLVALHTAVASFAVSNSAKEPPREILAACASLKFFGVFTNYVRSQRGGNIKMIHHNATLNFSHAPYKNKASLSELDREIEMGELRLRYIQLMRDVHKTLGREDAIELIKESEAIWEKLTS